MSMACRKFKRVRADHGKMAARTPLAASSRAPRIDPQGAFGRRRSSPRRRPSMAPDSLVSAFVTLLVVVDPVGLAPTFLALTTGLSAPARRRIALRACLIAAAVLAGAAFGGDWLFKTLGISLPAFRIAGGLLLFSIASEMVFGVRIARQSKTAEQAVEEHVHDIAAFPLAIPLMAGPGAITATVLLAGRAEGHPAALALLIGVILAVLAICYGAFL